MNLTETTDGPGDRQTGRIRERSRRSPTLMTTVDEAGLV